MKRTRLSWSETFIVIFAIGYLGVGLIFAILPFLFGAYKVAFMMLVCWPAIFLR